MKVMEVIWDLIDLSITGLAGVSRRIAFMEKPSPKPSPSAGISEVMWSRVQAGKTYLKALMRLIISCAVFPIPILIIGIFGDLGWLVAMVGIFWTIWSFLLLALATPIGLLLEFILGGIKGIADRYIKFSLGVFLVELLFTLFISVVPIQNNLSAIPIVIVASAILGIIAARGVQMPVTQKFISFMVTMIFIVFTLSFFFPKTFNSFRNWSTKLDVEVSNQVEGVPSIPKNPAPMSASPLRTDKEKSQIDLKAQPPPVPQQVDTLLRHQSEQAALAGYQNPVRVRRIAGTAWSYSKEKWAEVAPLFSSFDYGGDGTYPKADLVFSSGLAYGYPHMTWDASYAVFPEHINVTLKNLSIAGSSIAWRDWYIDVGIGYDVLLENAVFADYTMTKSLIVFKTFGGDSPPPSIKKDFEIKKVDLLKEEAYSIAGEWVGSLSMVQENDKRIIRRFIGRFVQHGNKFEGVILDYTMDIKDSRGYSDRTRFRVEGLIVDDRVTFVKTYKEQPIGDSYVAPFIKGDLSLKGKCYSGMFVGDWNMTRRGDFQGSPDDILDAGLPMP